MDNSSDPEHKLYNSDPNQAYKDRPIVICPYCKNDRCEHIHRSFIHKTFFSFLNLRKFRCRKCFKKFYKKAGDKRRSSESQ